MHRRAHALRRAVALAALLAPLATRPAPLTDPLGLGTPGPVRQLFLDPVLADARAVTRPALSTRLDLANSWSVPTVLERRGQLAFAQLDAESEALVVSARVPWALLPGKGEGWRGRVASTLSWRATVFWGGFTDGGIEAWHHLVHSYNFQRQFYPTDRLRLRLGDLGGAQALALGSATFAVGDAVVGTQALLLQGGASALEAGAPAWGVAARLDLKLPVGALSRAGGSGGVDAALSLLGSAEAARWLVLHGRLSAGVVSPLGAPIALQPRRLQTSAEVSAVATASGWSFVLEDRLVSPLLEDGWRVVDGGADDVFVSSAGAALLRWHNQISVGVRRGGVTLAFAEDFTPGHNPRGEMKWFYDSNAPDVVLTLGWTKEW